MHGCLPGFILYLLVSVLFTIYLIYWVAPVAGTTHISVYLGICSIVGSITVMCVKVGILNYGNVFRYCQLLKNWDQDSFALYPTASESSIPHFYCHVTGTQCSIEIDATRQQPIFTLWDVCIHSSKWSVLQWFHHSCGSYNCKIWLELMFAQPNQGSFISTLSW